jgi:hypothetical protein
VQQLRLVGLVSPPPAPWMTIGGGREPEGGRERAPVCWGGGGVTAIGGGLSPVPVSAPSAVTYMAAYSIAATAHTQRSEVGLTAVECCVSAAVECCVSTAVGCCVSTAVGCCVSTAVECCVSTAVGCCVSTAVECCMLTAVGCCVSRPQVTPLPTCPQGSSTGRGRGRRGRGRAESDKQRTSVCCWLESLIWRTTSEISGL